MFCKQIPLQFDSGLALGVFKEGGREGKGGEGSRGLCQSRGMGFSLPTYHGSQDMFEVAVSFPPRLRRAVIVPSCVDRKT